MVLLMDTMPWRRYPDDYAARGNNSLMEMGSPSTPAQPTLGSARLKVLHVGKFYPPHLGGIETHLQTLCGQLQRVADVRLIVASDDSNGSEENLDGVSVSRVPTRLTLSSAPICPGMIAAINKSNADIIHLHWPNPMAVLAYLASRHRGRLVITYHSDTIRQKLLSAAFEPFLQAALRRSSAIIITSPDYGRSSRILSTYRERCHVIPLGIDTAAFGQRDPARVAALRQQYGDRVVLSVGRLVYYKGFEHLIQAMTLVRGKLLIIGDGPLGGKLRDLAVRLGVSDRVVLTGEIPDSLIPYYQAADLFALPSVARTEAFGIVQVEAMAAGLPVVNTRIDSGVPFVSLHEQTGLTVPPADPDTLATALNRLLDDDVLRQSLGQAAMLRAQQEFSMETMASRTMALYQSVAAQS